MQSLKIFIILNLFILFMRMDLKSQIKDTSTKNNTQTTNLFIVGTIKIIGNKITKNKIILRELYFKENDTLNLNDTNRLKEIITQSKNLLINTSLFLDVSIDYAFNEFNIIDFTISVKERWYIFPQPYFKFSERNLTEWIDDGLSLAKINFGTKTTHNNLTGHNDKLTLYLITGYADLIGIKYQTPFIDKKLQKGITFGYTYITQARIDFQTINNQQKFYSTKDKLIYSNNAFSTFQYRPNKKSYHQFSISYNHVQIADSLYYNNKNYFPDSSKKYEYTDFSYNYQYQKINYLTFPSDGIFFKAGLSYRFSKSTEKYWSINLNTIYAVPFNNKFFFKTVFISLIKNPNIKSFYNQPLLGYGNFLLRGLDANVIDGYAGFVSNNSFYLKLLTFKTKFFIHKKSLNKIPFTFYLHNVLDFGYAKSDINNTYNKLNNTFLRTAGLGIDIIGIYDFILKIDYSYNQFNQTKFAINLSATL